MAKFKVGDKVRILDTCNIVHCGKVRNGDIFEVEVVESYGMETSRENDGLYLGIWAKEYKHIELVETKPSKNERISLLESQVAELHAKVEALQKRRKPAVALTQAPTIHNVTVNLGESTVKTAEQLSEVFRKFSEKYGGNKPTPNEQRKAVIERAKAFVADAIRDNQSGFVGYEHETKTIKLHVNKEKRAVTALVYRDYDFALIAKAIAKCAPDDVFNADIGKAIALGRALGLDVSEFENAVKPTEVVVGMVVETRDTFGKSHIDRIAIIEEFNGMAVAWFDDSRNRGADINDYSGKGSTPVIVEDTEAQY